MCGIAGLIVNKNFNSKLNFSFILDGMSIYIRNRGPDSLNKWISDKEDCAMVHSRLSIIGLGVNGDQPMISHDERFIISFNGEIYNFVFLRNELNKNFQIKWRGNSDTEVLVEGISRLGFENFISKVEGMFSIAIWDRRLKILTLARDRMGEKPLYYGKIINNDFEAIAFSSDIGSFTKLSKSNLKMNKNSICEFIKNGWITGPKTIYEDVFKLLPGEYIKISNHNNAQEIKKYKYWNKKYKFNRVPKFSDIDKEINDIESLLLKTLKEQLYSERDIAIFLSGGIDSTLIAALAKKELGVEIKCFTCGFGGDLDIKNYDETIFAKSICNNLDLPHVIKKISSNDVSDTLPKMASIYSEPFADISQIGIYLVSKKARESGIIVALAGDGGDELFGGYERYLSGKKLLFLKKYLPRFILNYASSSTNLLPDFLSEMVGNLVGINNIKFKIEKFFNNLDDFYDKESLYLACLSKWDKFNFEELGFGNDFSINYESINSIKIENNNLDLRTYMMIMDIENYLVDDVLVKTDRASMSLGLEVRAPFLNHNLVSYAINIPTSSKFSSKGGKVHLKKILGKYINKRYINRPKKGFSIPVDQMLRTSAKEWSNEMICNLKKNSEIPLNHKLIERIWNEHLSGERNHGSSLWNLIMLSSWIDKWR